jgi:peptidylprolyl isomerase
MRTAQAGDRVLVHYCKQFSDGTSRASRSHAPLEITVGAAHPRLPGLGAALIGLAPGERMQLRLPPEKAYGPVNPARIRRWSRARFPQEGALPIGRWLPVVDRRGRRGRVRVLEVSGSTVVVDTNHPHAGQALVMDVELVGFVSNRAEGR